MTHRFRVVRWWCFAMWCVVSAAGLQAKEPMPPGSHELTLRHGGLERAFTVHVPRSYRGDHPAPLCWPSTAVAAACS